MAALPLCQSKCGEFLVHSSHDGVIKVWETATNSLKTEYKPASHLSASCSCLSWWKNDDESTSPKKKKKKRHRHSEINVSGELEELNTVAIGTVSGTILLYSVAKGDLHTQLDKGHDGRVNDISWFPSSNTLYSCSDDTSIVEWEISTTRVKHKWKADKGPVHSLCRCSKSHLLSASRSIKLWDLSTKQLLMVFTGHATEVFKLLHIPRLDGSPSVENSYFLSSAVNDRVINVWQINTTSHEKNALASFTMAEEPVSVQVSSPRDKPIILIVVTKCGKALLFEHRLNGKLKKPLKPKLTIQVASGSGKDDVRRPLQILSAYIADEDGSQVMLMHGNYLRPTFEKVSTKTTDKELLLVREDPMKVTVKKESSNNVTKIKTPDVSKDMTLLVPGHSAPMLPTQDETTSKSLRRKRKASGEMTMEDRLNAISISKPGSEGEAPRADTLATLLSQGLYSQDKSIINSVLEKGQPLLVKNTIKNLPIQMVIPLVQELTWRMQQPGKKAFTPLIWTKNLLEVHTSYLMTFPQIIDTLSSLYQMMDTRVVVLGKLSRLQGKLDLLLSQVSAQAHEEEPTISQQPLLQFDEESSDDDLDDFPIGVGASDSEENWEDFSSEDEEEDMDTHDKDNKG